MKPLRTKTWVLVLAAVFLLLAGALLAQKLTARPAASAAVYVDGELVRTIDLTADGAFRIETGSGWNELAVRDGKIAVVSASCPDGDCVRCGWRNSGPPITCLPNRMTIRFSEASEVDAVAR